MTLDDIQAGLKLAVAEWEEANTCPHCRQRLPHAKLFDGLVEDNRAALQARIDAARGHAPLKSVEPGDNGQ